MAYTLNIMGNLREFDKPLVMGIVNLTPDSFFAASRAIECGPGDMACGPPGPHFRTRAGGPRAIEGHGPGGPRAIEERVGRMLSEGMDILDLGAVSTRPGAEEVSEEEEWRRLEAPLKAVTQAFPDLIVSVDTFRAEIARRAADCGACIINDVSGGADEEMFETVGRLQLPYILTFNAGQRPAPPMACGRPRPLPSDDVCQDADRRSARHMEEGIHKARMCGVHDIILDPGFGFNKTVAQNYQTLARLKAWKQVFHLPLLVGLSRKSMLYKPLGITPEEALNATTAAHTIALMNGADILRAHDVKQAAECIKIYTQYCHGSY